MTSSCRHLNSAPVNVAAAAGDAHAAALALAPAAPAACVQLPQPRQAAPMQGGLPSAPTGLPWHPQLSHGERPRHSPPLLVPPQEQAQPPPLQHHPLPQKPRQAQPQAQPQTRPPQQTPQQTLKPRQKKNAKEPPKKKTNAPPKKRPQPQPKPPPADPSAYRRDEGRWHQRFEELRAYRDAHGDCNVPQKYAANPALARWVSQQRVEYKKFLFLRIASSSSDPPPSVGAETAAITQDRVSALDAVGFEWDAFDGAWLRKFEELCAYRARHGHCDVPLRYADNPSLGRWVVRQRHEMRQLREGRLGGQMTEARRRALDGAGFVWDARDRTWNARWEELRRYRDEHGHCDVPYGFEGNVRLGHWVRNQRTQYSLRRAGRRHRLTDERMRRLEELGFSWVVTPASAADRAGGRRREGRGEGGGDGGDAEEEEAFGEELSVDDDVRRPTVFGEELSVDDDVRKPY